MVAYSFKKQFVPAIQAGLEPGPWVPGMKRHTLRHKRKRQVRPKERMDLYYGMRTRHCSLIARVVCIGAVPLYVGWKHGEFAIYRRSGEAVFSDLGFRELVASPLVDLALQLGGTMRAPQDLAEAFARADGFKDLAAMEAFFGKGVEDRDGFFSLTALAWRPGVPA